MSSCFPWWHQWNRWETYEEAGTAFPQFLTNAVQTTYSETRQYRTCKRCGKTQDEWVHGDLGDTSNWTKIHKRKENRHARD